MWLKSESLHISKYLIMKEDTDDFQNNQIAYEGKPVSKQVESFLLPNKKEITLRQEREKSIKANP